MGETLLPEVKRQVDMIENLIKSRVAVGSQIARSRVVNTLRNSVVDWKGTEFIGILSALTKRRDFDEKNQGKLLVRLR